MSDIYFKASLQNTLNPEVGTFDNVNNKEGIFTLEDGEYYLTNNTESSYGVYYPTKSIYSVGFTVEFDINYTQNYGFHWCLLFSGDDSTYWFGIGVDERILEFRGQALPDYRLITSPTFSNTWLHVKCIFDYYNSQNHVHIYIDNVEVNNFIISNNYGIKHIDILGNNDRWVTEAKIKNIIIYSNSNSKRYLDTSGLTSLWSKIKSLFATKTELASKANDSDVIHKSGDETIVGTKTFISPSVGGPDSGLIASNSGTNHSLLFGVGGSGVNRGIYDNKNTRWSIYLNDTDYIMTQCPTPPAGDSSNKLATTEWVQTETSSAIRAQWYAAYPDGPEAHNAMWGGRDITAAFNNGTVSANIANGTFKDIFPGDYITKQVTIPQVLADDGTTKLFTGGTYTVNWVITDCDYWINKGDTATTAHHVAIVSQQPIFSIRMNATNTTEGGYKGSEMFKKIIPACATGIVSAFGSSHILTFRDAITNSVDNSHVSSGITQYMGTPGWFGEFVSVQCNLMSEMMVYGAPICSAGAANNVMATRQMSAFRSGGKLINYNRSGWWLRDVVSSTYFAYVSGYVNANSSYASSVRGVRPFALLV